MTGIPPDEVRLLERIKVLALDVDGVLTDGKVYYDNSGQEARAFYVPDGAGLVYWHRAGRGSALISGRQSKLVEMRAQELRIGLVLQGRSRKSEALDEVLAHFGVQAAEVAYMGDDLLDLPVLRRVGYPVAVANACGEVLQVARHVTQRRGGEGAVRELIERLLLAQGRWTELLP